MVVACLDSYCWPVSETVSHSYRARWWLKKLSVLARGPRRSAPERTVPRGREIYEYARRLEAKGKGWCAQLAFRSDRRPVREVEKTLTRRAVLGSRSVTNLLKASLPRIKILYNIERDVSQYRMLRSIF